MDETPKKQRQGAAEYWKGAAKRIRSVRSIAGSGLLAAAGAAIKSLSIDFGPLLRINFAFLTFALSGFLYGPLVAGMTATVVDIIGYLLKPTAPYFFGYTLNAFLNGFLYGLWLYERQVKLWRCFAACLTSMVVVSFLLNPLWLHIQYGEAFWALVALRVPKNAILLPINTLLLFGLLQVVKRGQKRLVPS